MISNVLLPSKLKRRPRNTCPLIKGRPSLTRMKYSSVGVIRSAHLNRSKDSAEQVPSDYHILVEQRSGEDPKILPKLPSLTLPCIRPSNSRGIRSWYPTFIMVADLITPTEVMRSACTVRASSISSIASLSCYPILSLFLLETCVWTKSPMKSVGERRTQPEATSRRQDSTLIC